MEMEDQYAMADLRHLMNSHSHFSDPTTAPDLFSSHPPPHYANLLMIPPRGPYDHPRYTTTAVSGVPATSSAGCVDTDLGSFGGDGGTGRWPRQETLTLLEIRSRLDPKFKETNQKGPLWDDVSRIMCEEHGYQRSGKKCREKFENLYKYYKKTKEGKAGRQDGKHYRFFRQLEALYGHHSTSTQKQVLEGPATTLASQGGSFSLSTSSEVETSSSEEEDESGTGKQVPRRRKWKAKVREFVDAQMRRLTEKQEAWLENMVKTIEQKENERILREQEWRAQEASRLEREHRFWANERAWIKTRDAALLEALQKIIERRDNNNNNPMQEEMMREIQTDGDAIDNRRWCESEIARLVQPQNTNDYDLTRSLCCFSQLNTNVARKPVESSPTNSNGGGTQEGGFRFVIGDDGGNSNMWEGYGMKENR